MKTVILLFVFFINSILSSFSQRNNDTDNNYLTLVSASMENQITGANTENSSRMVYNINLKARSAFYLKKIEGKINDKNLKGKIIYNNTILDSAIIADGNNFTIRFEKYNVEPSSHHNNNLKKYANNKCYKNGKNLNDNSLFFLSYFIDNKQYHLNVKCSRKVISLEKQLPQ